MCKWGVHRPGESHLHTQAVRREIADAYRTRRERRESHILHDIVRIGPLGNETPHVGAHGLFVRGEKAKKAAAQIESGVVMKGAS